MDRHNPIPNNSSSDIIRGQSLSLRNGVYQPVREENILLRDTTLNDVSITKHGLAPKAPNDATKYLDGTGAYSIPNGALAEDDLLWAKQAWTNASLLPATNYKAGNYLFPAFDFSNSGGTVAREAGYWRDGGTGATRRFCWDLGGGKAKILLITGGFLSSNFHGFYVSDATTNADGEITGNGFLYDISTGGALTVYKFTAGAAAAQTADYSDMPGYTPQACAFAFEYVGGSYTRLWLKLAGGWMPTAKFTSASFTTMRMVGVRMFSSGKTYLSTPLQVWYTT